MKVLFVSAETAPYSMVGGLSQVTYFLAKALIKLGHDIRVFTPKYGCNSNPSIPSSPSLKFIFYENQHYFGSRQNVYGCQDDPARFANFSRGCLEWLLQLRIDSRNLKLDLEARKSNLKEPVSNFQPQDPASSLQRLSSKSWFPDVIHCHDWHTGMLIHWLKNDPKYSAIKNIPVLYTVHNFSYTGGPVILSEESRRVEGSSVSDSNISIVRSSLDPSGNPQDDISPLSLGLLSADLVNTVSPTYAKEIKLPGLTGILNGLDNEEFNPSTDPNIEFNYSSSVIAPARPIGGSPAMAGRGNLFNLRQKNKIYLQKLFFPAFARQHRTRRAIRDDPASRGLLLAFSGRLCPQKGIDLILKTLPRLLKIYPQVQFIALGDGDSAYKTKLIKLAKSFPRQVGLYLKSDFQKPRQIFAGADIMLIPSRFEPCGIIALESLRYGCVPLINRTGGLNDIVTDFNPKTKKGWGFSFSALSANFPNFPKSPKFPNCPDFASALISAIKLYQNKPKWHKLVQNCLSGDFSWDHSALEYEKLYQKLLQN